MRSIPITLEGYEHRYEVTEDGGVISLQRNGKRGRWAMAGKVTKLGYRHVCLTKAKSWKTGAYKTVSVHKLVALAFIGPKGRWLEINHKDGDKLNNALNNLEYVTRSENHIHAHKTGLHNEYGKFKKRPVIATHEITGHERKFYAINEAARYGFKSGAIVLCCQGKQGVHHGYRWKYKEK